MPQIIIPRLSEVTIRQEGTRVLLIQNGRLLLDLTHDAARAIARAITIKALLAEEEAKAESIIFDQAILMRAGASFGLTNRRDMQHEAGKLAAWDTDLRRYIRGKRAYGIESREVFGTPSIIRHNPPSGDDSTSSS